MNLSSMRDIDTTDPIGGLGPKVTPAPKPAPEPYRRPDGIVIGPDGKWSTDFPDPTVPTPMPAPAEDPALKCSACDWRGGLSEALTQSNPGETVNLCPDCNRQTLQEAVKSPPPQTLGELLRRTRAPLQIGDRVRLLAAANEVGVPVYEIGIVMSVIANDGRSLSVGPGWMVSTRLEGLEWERA